MTRFRASLLAVAWIALSIFASPCLGQETRNAQLIASAEKALESHESGTALRLVNKALQSAPKNQELLLFRARIHEIRDEFPKGLADLDTVVSLAPKWVDGYEARGKLRFEASDFKGSVADFDKFLELRPEATPAHWQRGISLYYAGEYARGRDQFAAYQTHDNADVENAVWHYLCNAKVVGNEQARKEIPVVGEDRRIPLMKVYELFTGKGTVEDVEKAADVTGTKLSEARRRDFYKNLYLGLYYVSEDQPDKGLEHLQKAADPMHKYTDYNYMWQVARVHTKLLTDAKTDDKPAAGPAKTE
jgi:lipoprotein NlpI